MPDISEFNSNALVVKRVNEIIYKLNGCFEFNDIDGAIKQLRALYKEIFPKLTIKERLVYPKLCAVIQRAQALPKDTQRVLGNIGMGKVLFELEQVDMDLRLLADKHGMLMTNKDDPRLAVLKG